jgi:hypothetical protein
VPVLRLRSELRARAAVRAASALLGVLAGVVVLKLAGEDLGGSSALTLLVPLIALLGGLIWHRLGADALNERLSGITELPADATPHEGSIDRSVIAAQAGLVALVTVALGLIFGAGGYAAVLILAVILAFVFADLLSAREVEVLEEARAAIVYTPSGRGKDFDGPLYAARR